MTTDRQTMKLELFTDFAIGLSQLSTCKRLKVGCVVTTRSFSEVLSIGYNGPAAGLPNDSCRSSEGSCGEESYHGQT